MGNFHRERSGQRVTVADQEPVDREGLHCGVHRHGVHIEIDELRCGNRPAGLGVPADRHHPQEQLAGRFLLVAVQILVDRFGATGDCTPDPAQLPIGGQRKRRALPAVEQLGEGVLEEGQGVGLTTHLIDHGRQQPPLEVDARSQRRSQRGRFELSCGERHDVDDVARHQPPKGGCRSGRS